MIYIFTVTVLSFLIRAIYMCIWNFIEAGLGSRTWTYILVNNLILLKIGIQGFFDKKRKVKSSSWLVLLRSKFKSFPGFAKVLAHQALCRLKSYWGPTGLGQRFAGVHNRQRSQYITTCTKELLIWLWQQSWLF